MAAGWARESGGGWLRHLWGNSSERRRWDIVPDAVTDKLEDWRDTGEDKYEDAKERLADYWFNKQFDLVFGTLYYYLRYTWRRRLEEATSQYAVKAGIACVVFTSSVVAVLYLGKRLGYLDRLHTWWRQWRRRGRHTDDLDRCRRAAHLSSSLVSPAHLDMLQILDNINVLPSVVEEVNYTHLLQVFLTQLHSRKNGLLLDLNSGYSSISLALSLPEDGRLLVCDDSSKSREVLHKISDSLAREKVENKIEFTNESAQIFLENLLKRDGEESLDFCVVDVNSGKLRHHYELCLQLLREGGIMFITGVLESDSFETDGMPADSLNAKDRLNQQLMLDDRVTTTTLPWGRGFTILIKNLGHRKYN